MRWRRVQAPDRSVRGITDPGIVATYGDASDERVRIERQRGRIFMRVLIIGGTRFIGRHIAQAALDRGHQLTLFNRGQTNAHLFPEAEHVRGDRHQDGLAAVSGRQFDAIIDSSAYFPGDVELAGQLAASTSHYSLISSLSVYRDPVVPGSDESAPVWELKPPIPDEYSSPETYGGLKVLCERTAHQLFAGRALAVRAGIAVGPHDYTDRFTYWPRRIDEGGPVLAATPDQPVQFIDVRDLATWVLDTAERRVTGTFNATGPAHPLTMAEFLAACRDTTGGDATPVWTGDRFLLDHGLEPWEDLPFWLPSDLAAFCQIDTSAAQAAGLRIRPLAETIRDVFAWDQSRPADERGEPLTRSRERELLAAATG
jgi:2'-hydroxyisoflavone reductase